MAEFASKGVAGSGLGLGIAGTALGLLNNGGGNNGGILGGLFGGCSGNNVSQYELNQESRISNLMAEVALRDANIYNDQKMLEMYKFFDGELRSIRNALCEQATYNATQTGAIGCIREQVAQLQGLTKMVIPNTSICPGWGNVTTTITPTTTTPTTPA